MTEDNMQQPPESQQPQGDSFGFAAQPKNEKYNTEFLVANLEADKKRTKLIVLAILVAVLGAVGILIAAGAGGEKPASTSSH